MARLRLLVFFRKLTVGLLSQLDGRRSYHGGHRVRFFPKSDAVAGLRLGNGDLLWSIDAGCGLSRVSYGNDWRFLQFQRCISHVTEHKISQDEEPRACREKPAQGVGGGKGSQQTLRLVEADELLDRDSGEGELSCHSLNSGVGGNNKEDLPNKLSIWELANCNASETPSKSPILTELLATLNKIKKTDNLAIELAPFEGKISCQDATTMIKLLSNKDLCFGFYTWLKEQENYTPNLTSLLTVIQVLVVTKKWKKLAYVTQDLFDAGFVLHNSIYCRIIKAVSWDDKINVCEWWFHKMKEKGCQPDQTTYNTMIHAYALAALRDKSFDLFEEMKGMGISPDINTFCHLLISCQKIGDVEGAHKVFLQIGNHGLTPNLVSYSILLNAYVKLGKTTEAVGLSNEIRKAGIPLDAKAYTSILNAYGKAGIVDQATTTFHEYQKSAGQNPDKIVFWTMLHLYCGAGLLKEALGVKKMMRVAQLPVDVSCYTSLIKGFMNKEQWKDAARAFKEMQRYKYPISEGTYILMMETYANIGHHIDCERIFDQMMTIGYKGKLAAYEIMVNIYKKINNIPNAKRIFELMKQNNCPPSENIYNSMIHMFAKAGMLPACEKLFEEMRIARLKPNKNTFLTLIRAYAVYGDYLAAMAKFGMMQDAGVKPDFELAQLILEVLLKNGEVQKAEEFLKEIVAAGINPTKRMVDAVLLEGGAPNH